MTSLVQVTAWERSAPWKRILCALLRVGLLIVIVGLLINLYGPPLFMLFMARWEAKKLPFLRQTPKPLMDYSVSAAPGTTIKQFGYEFEVPWQTPYKTKQTKTVNWLLLTFDSGQKLLFIAPPESEGLFSELAQDRSPEMRNLGLSLGDLTKLSPYDQYRTLLETTPSTIHPFISRPLAARGMVLLTMKAIAPGGSIATGDFSFAMPGKRGFQFGDPQKPGGLQLEVFGEGNHWIEILLSPAENARLTQPEINRILTTLHRLPDKASAYPAK
jgi:hypothetical protein